jgi:hypothetical protein
MSGLSRLERDFGRFQVTDLSDHDDVGILPQDRAQAGGEGEAGLFRDRDLIDPR